jgi:hypothetical protein
LAPLKSPLARRAMLRLWPWTRHLEAQARVTDGDINGAIVDYNDAIVDYNDAIRLDPEEPERSLRRKV